jgi:hypothetical protein
MSHDDEQWSGITEQQPSPDWAAAASGPGGGFTADEAGAVTDDEDWPTCARSSLLGLVRSALRSEPHDPADAEEDCEPALDGTPAGPAQPAPVPATTGRLRALTRPLLVATAAFAVSGIATALWYPGSTPSPTAAAAGPGSAQSVPNAWTTPTQDSRPPAARAKNAPGPGQATFSAVTGPSCPTSATASFNPVGYWTDSGLAGWLSHSGGLASEGCSGTFLAMPMSGDTTSAGDGGSWLFTPGISAGTCTAAVYIPAVSNAVYNGGDPAYYAVSDALTGGRTLGTTSVDQAADAGKWVPLGQYPVPAGGVLQIQLSDRGVDWTASGPDFAHLSVDAARLDCKA